MQYDKLVHPRTMTHQVGFCAYVGWALLHPFHLPLYVIYLRRCQTTTPGTWTPADFNPYPVEFHRSRIFRTLSLHLCYYYRIWKSLPHNNPHPSTTSRIHDNPHHHRLAISWYINKPVHIQFRFNALPASTATSVILSC